MAALLRQQQQQQQAWVGVGSGRNRQWQALLLLAAVLLCALDRSQLLRAAAAHCPADLFIYLT